MNAHNPEFNPNSFDSFAGYLNVLEEEGLNTPVSNESYEGLHDSIVGILDKYKIDQHQSNNISARQMKYEGVEGWKADISIEIMTNSEANREWDAKVLIFNNQSGSSHATLTVNESAASELFFVSPDLPYISYTLRRGEYGEPVINCSSGFGVQEVSRSRCEEIEAVALAGFIDDVFSLNKTRNDL